MNRFFDPQSGSAPVTASVGPAAKNFRLASDSTVVMSDYHLVKYDAILGVLVCVGDDSDVLVLGKDMFRELIPLKRGSHWLDCSLYVGTSTFLLLSPDALLCMDYHQRDGDSSLTCRDATEQFTTLCVPQGLTVGVVGRKNGCVSYFRLSPVSNNPSDRPRLVWTTKSLNLIELCQPFCTQPIRVDPPGQSQGKFFAAGSVLSIDSYPENPNAYIGVVAGVRGVCKWYVDEARLSCYFDAATIAGLPDNELALCRVTPGGTYVAALTMQATKVLFWSESKKKKKVAPLHWVVDLSGGVSKGLTDNHDAFWFNEYRVGLNMARTALDEGFRATNDKHSQLYLLLHGQREILEVVVVLEDKQVKRKEPILANLTATTAEKGVEAAKTRSDNALDDYFNVFHVEPCVLSNYWHSGWTDVDLEALFITSQDGLRPILAKRDRQKGGIANIKELRELSAAVPWCPNGLLLRLPESTLRNLARHIKDYTATSTWEKLFRGGSNLLPYALPEVEEAALASGEPDAIASSKLWRQTAVVTVTGAAAAVCLSPQSNEAFSVPPKALRDCAPWESLDLAGHDADKLVLEQALPALDICYLPTEVIIRVFANAEFLTVMKHDIRRNTGHVALDLDRRALQMDIDSGGAAAAATGGCVVQQAHLVDARLEPSTVSTRMNVFNDGKSLLMLVDDGSVVLVTLNGAKDESGLPYMLRVPAGLLPVGASIASIDAFWLPNQGGQGGAFCLAALFKEGKGFLIWNFSAMKMVSYGHAPFATDATRLCVTTAPMPPLPNMSGETAAFDVMLSLEDAPQCGEYGAVHCFDTVGCCLFSLALGFGLAANCPSMWCYRYGVGEEEQWLVLAELPRDSRQLVLHGTVQGSSLVWSLEAGGVTATGSSSLLQGSIVSIKTTWIAGKAELVYDKQNGEMCSYLLSSAMSRGSAMEDVMPTLAFISASQIALVEVAALVQSSQAGGGMMGASSASTAAPTATIRLDPTRRLEHFSVYRGRGALIVVTRDANGWRWLNILDSRTAKPRMDSCATLNFAGEEKVQILLMEVGNVLHLYILGSNNGVVGHLSIEANLQSAQETSIITRRVFFDRRYRPVPSTFRGYGRFLPPAPTLKQETGFFKRLMTLPWEDIALKLESETLRDVREGAANAPAMAPPANVGPSNVAATTPTTPASPGQQQQPQKPQAGVAAAAAERAELLGQARASTTTTQPAAAASASTSDPAAAGASTSSSSGPTESRYAQLKAIAARENVSLNEARRMMSENVRKLQQRGERLDEMQNRSAELANQALSFQELARQLKEKQRSSWL